MGNKLYVGNLPFNTTENELQELFAQAGAVQEVMLMQDKFTGKSRGFAFVTMGSDQDAQNAISKFNGHTLENRALRRRARRLRRWWGRLRWWSPRRWPATGPVNLAFFILKAPDHQIRRLFIFGNGHVCRDLGMRSRWYSEPQPHLQGA